MHCRWRAGTMDYRPWLLSAAYLNFYCCFCVVCQQALHQDILLWLVCPCSSSPGQEQAPVAHCWGYEHHHFDALQYIQPGGSTSRCHAEVREAVLQSAATMLSGLMLSIQTGCCISTEWYCRAYMHHICATSDSRCICPSRYTLDGVS